MLTRQNCGRSFTPKGLASGGQGLIYTNRLSQLSGSRIWTAWRAGTPEEQRSFSILTTSANEFVAKILERMPVIPDENQWQEWLELEVLDPTGSHNRQVAAAMPFRPGMEYLRTTGRTRRQLSGS